MPETVLGPKKTHFYLNQKIQSGELLIKANKIYDEIISVLNQSPEVNLDVYISIEAYFADGADEKIVRDVSENLSTLKMNQGEWS